MTVRIESMPTKLYRAMLLSDTRLGGEWKAGSYEETTGITSGSGLERDKNSNITRIQSHFRRHMQIIAKSEGWPYSLTHSSLATGISR